MEVFLSGVATSLLFSAFESRIVSTRSHLGLDSQSLSAICFSHVTFGHGVIAVVGALGSILLLSYY